ncbi:MAG: DNA internalization-related competence protein ComEC/Rec2 [Clostridia bacterium]|nr:DNA internalization-related competence protein ComEC/Rec2 [Clostridia bacterium]
MAWDPVQKWMDRRPLMFFAVCLTCGMAAGYQNAVPWWIWAAALAVCAVPAVLTKRRVLVFSSALMLGAMLVTLSLIRPTVTEQDGVLLCGTVASEAEKKEEYTYFLLADAEADGQELPTKVMVYLHDDDLPPLEYGMKISFTANTYLPSDHRNPYEGSYEEYLWRMGAALCASSWESGLTILEMPGPSLTGWAIRCRLYLQSVVERIYAEDIAPLVCALLLGDRSLLPDEVYDSFRIAGQAHLLAISGLHISCLAVALDYLLRKMHCREKAAFGLVTAFLLVYAAVIGFPPSINRAVLMYVLSCGARLFGRPSDGLTGLSMALIVLLLINPLDIADVSLILSFSSVAGMMILTKLITARPLLRVRGRLHTPVRWTATALSASLSAQLGALPAVACVFGSLPSYALMASLPSLPLMTFTLPAAMVGVVIGCVSQPVGRVIAFPVEWALRLLIWFNQWVSGLPGATIDSPVWPAWLILLYVLFFVLCSQASNIRRRLKQILICGLPVMAVAALLLPFTFPTTGLEVLFLDAGQADAAVIRAEEQYYLMDVGEDSVSADYLRSSGIRPAGVFLTHPHSDHAGGLEDVVELCEPAVIFIPCLWDEVEADDGVHEMMKKAQDAGWIIRTLQRGDEVRLSDHVRAVVHQPWTGMTDDANGSSLVMSVCLGDASVLFTGDLTAEDENSMFPDCDVLKVAHHGAKGSTSSLFLKMTTPSVAVISVGYNSYGHPRPETIARLEEAGAAVYRTDECGAVSVLLMPDRSIEVKSINSASESEGAA